MQVFQPNLSQPEKASDILEPSRSNPSRTLRDALGLTSRFNKNRNGNVAILFALLIVPVVSSIGSAVDYGGALKNRTQLQTALDAAALAGGRTYQTSGSVSEAKAEAKRYFDIVMADEPTAKLSNAELNPDDIVLTLDGELTYSTYFLGVIGINEIQVSARSQSALAQGGNGKDIEISMMLDTTGSMRHGSKMTDLKLAAKDLVNIVVQGNQQKHTTRIALAPFAHAVRLNDAQFEAATGLSADGRDDTCVVERGGSAKFSDNAPTGNDTMTWHEPVAYRGDCDELAEVVPLSSDKAALQAAIDDLPTEGYTAGHIGTMFAWYLLSENWSSVWGTDAAPGAYDPDNRTKIAILMTDGEFNTEYIDANGDSDKQARKTCQKMKAAGITVYTVGFELTENDAKKTMAKCASSKQHAYLAENGSDLRLAFRDIAMSIAQLRLTE